MKIEPSESTQGNGSDIHATTVLPLNGPNTEAEENKNPHMIYTTLECHVDSVEPFFLRTVSLC